VAEENVNDLADLCSTLHLSAKSEDIHEKEEPVSMVAETLCSSRSIEAVNPEEEWGDTSTIQEIVDLSSFPKFLCMRLEGAGEEDEEGGEDEEKLN